jgi:DNA polymerase
MYDHSCTLCPLHEQAKHVCMEAAGEAVWPGMIIGEAPGAQEDDLGTPFVGRSGRVLDRALHHATGLSTKVVRGKIIVTNAVKCRPPNNATPTAQQLDACVVYLEKEIEQHDPVGILSVGNVPTITLLGQGGITAMRQQEWYLNRDHVTRVFPTFHPAYVLRQGNDSDAAEMFREDVAEFIRYIGGTR